MAYGIHRFLRSLIVLSLLFIMVPVLAIHAHALEPQQIVEQLGKSYAWTDKVSMKFSMRNEGNLNASVYSDAEFVFINDGWNRCQWLGDEGWRNRDTGELIANNGIENDRVIQSLFSARDNGGQYFEEESVTGAYRDKGKVLVRTNGADYCKAERARAERGGASFGFFFPFSYERLPDLLKRGEVTVRMEEVDGVACRVLETKVPEGKIEAWVDPEHGYTLQRCKLTKEAGTDLDREGKPFSHVTPLDGVNSPVKRSVIEFSRLQGEQVGSDYVTTHALYTYTEELVNGKTVLQKSEMTISDINTSPDFEAMNAFKFSVPEGTRVFLLKDRSGRALAGFKWKDGRVVTNINEESLKSIEKTVVALREDTLVTPAKALKWNVIKESGGSKKLPTFLLLGGAGLVLLIAGVAIRVWASRKAKPPQTVAKD